MIIALSNILYLETHKLCGPFQSHYTDPHPAFWPPQNATTITISWKLKYTNNNLAKEVEFVKASCTFWLVALRSYKNWIFARNLITSTPPMTSILLPAYAKATLVCDPWCRGRGAAAPSRENLRLYVWVCKIYNWMDSYLCICSKESRVRPWVYAGTVHGAWVCIGIWIIWLMCQEVLADLQ